jgi:hypothetical protein
MLRSDRKEREYFAIPGINKRRENNRSLTPDHSHVFDKRLSTSAEGTSIFCLFTHIIPL